MTNKKLHNFFTDQELWRIIDLANRRVIDNGESCYSIEDQKLFIKMRKGRLLIPMSKRDYL